MSWWLSPRPIVGTVIAKTLQQSAQQAQQYGLVLEPTMADNLQRSLADAVQSQEMAGNPAVLLVTSPLRAAMAQFVRTGLEQLRNVGLPRNTR